ncbi:MAG: hypothetical protein SV775_14920 [Thermodesulfobacteriota bacterium]|nr:hypothetical protein [Thermodesulfobacteriota bacterium]
MSRFLVGVCCFIFLAAGCGEKAKEKAMEKEIEEATGTAADVNLSKNGMRITGETEEGKYTVAAGEETAIPKDFPTDVFIYRPSKAVMAMKIPEGHSIALTTGDDHSKVLSAYGREMKANGWSEKASMNMGSQSVLVYEKSGRAANITIVPSDKALQINVAVTNQ